jgi:hypothetical protein
MTKKFLKAITSILVIGFFSTLIFGQSKTDSTKPKDAPKPTLIGKWKSPEAKVEFIDKKTMTLNGQKFSYAVMGKIIIIQSDEGEAEFPFELKGDTLTVYLSDRKVIYKRYTEKDDEDEVNGETQSQTQPQGTVLPELVGKWCYQANVQAQGGGRQTDICFTLYANGTYEYYGESTSTNPNGGANSQSWDGGRWTATATTLTAYSNSGKTTTYTLEKRNHPKTGDPMLIVDGDAFVTYYQKQPW